MDKHKLIKEATNAFSVMKSEEDEVRELIEEIRKKSTITDEIHLTQEQIDSLRNHLPKLRKVVSVVNCAFSLVEFFKSMSRAKAEHGNGPCVNKY